MTSTVSRHGTGLKFEIAQHVRADIDDDVGLAGGFETLRRNIDLVAANSDRAELIAPVRSSRGGESGGRALVGKRDFRAADDGAGGDP